MSSRIYWAVQAIGLAPHDTTTFKETKGVQSCGITTTFNLEQVFELGQLEIYENIENIPDVEMTIEKVLDGHELLFHLCTRGAGTGSTLAARAEKRVNASLSIYGDTQESASGVPASEVNMSGMYLSSVAYSIPVEGNATESVTLVGNNKLWRSGAAADFEPTTYLNNDTPFETATSGGVQRRENINFVTTLLPSGSTGIAGITNGRNMQNSTTGVYGAHIQNINISADLGRESINELGRKGPYFRFVGFPVEVSCDVEVITTEGDQIEAREESENLGDQTIYVVMDESTTLDLGSKNKLSNVTYGGGDAGGGNATVTYSFLGYNHLVISHSRDPG